MSLRVWDIQSCGATSWISRCLWATRVLISRVDSRDTTWPSLLTVNLDPEEQGQLGEPWPLDEDKDEDPSMLERWSCPVRLPLPIYPSVSWRTRKFRSPEQYEIILWGPVLPLTCSVVYAFSNSCPKPLKSFGPTIIAVFPAISTPITNGSSPLFDNLGLTNERSLRMLFLSVTMSIERMSNEGFVVYNARNSGSSGLSGLRAAFWAM